MALTIIHMPTNLPRRQPRPETRAPRDTIATLIRLNPRMNGTISGMLRRLKAASATGGHER